MPPSLVNMIINELMDTVVHWDEPYIVIQTSRPFGSGYNVYKETEQKGMFKKVNDQLSWFISLDAAINCIKEHKGD